MHHKVICNAYDRNLGGRDFDEVLVKHFAAEFKEKYKLDVTTNARAMIRMRVCVCVCVRVYCKVYVLYVVMNVCVLVKRFAAEFNLLVYACVYCCLHHPSIYSCS